MTLRLCSGISLRIRLLYRNSLATRNQILNTPCQCTSNPRENGQGRGGRGSWPTPIVQHRRHSLLEILSPVGFWRTRGWHGVIRFRLTTGNTTTPLSFPCHPHPIPMQLFLLLTTKITRKSFAPFHPFYVSHILPFDPAILIAPFVSVLSHPSFGPPHCTGPRRITTRAPKYDRDQNDRG